MRGNGRPPARWSHRIARTDDPTSLPENHRHEDQPLHSGHRASCCCPRPRPPPVRVPRRRGRLRTRGVASARHAGGARQTDHGRTPRHSGRSPGCRLCLFLLRTSPRAPCAVGCRQRRTSVLRPALVQGIVWRCRPSARRWDRNGSGRAARARAAVVVCSVRGDQDSARPPPWLRVRGKLLGEHGARNSAVLRRVVHLHHPLQSHESPGRDRVQLVRLLVALSLGRRGPRRGESLVQRGGWCLQRPHPRLRHRPRLRVLRRGYACRRHRRRQPG